MISVGEETGKLDESFLFVAAFSEREVDEAIKTLTTVLEPLLMIVIGAIVGFLAVAIISPIYQLTKGLTM
jgi:type II secretory pathway component PulF